MHFAASSSLSSFWSNIGRSCCFALLLSFGCKDDSAAVSNETAPAPAAEPERFSFDLPKGYALLELRGEGSEALRAPPGASVRRANGRISIDAGSEFALDVRAEAPSLPELAAGIAAGERVLEEGDLIIYKSGEGFAFLMVQELVPEWDETERHRLACTSRGAGAPARADQATFSRSAVQNMVAACRSLQLPKLE